jgi:methionine sulfoxide reductase heme-binding subunit
MVTAAPTRRPALRARPLFWLVPAVVTGGLVPFGWLLFRAATRSLGADAVAAALNQLGLLALVLLVLSLACTPLDLAFGWKWPIRIRKTLGLLAFFYAACHALTYAVIDQALDLRAIASDILERKFIFVGFAAFVLLIPLAVTSTSGMLKRLGFKRWKLLHRLAYVAAGLGVLHFVWRVKKDVTEPVVYGAIVVALLAIRAAKTIRGQRRSSSG